MSLTTLNEIKAFLQITTTVTDALITTYRDIIESEIESYVNQNLTQSTYTEVLNYTDRNYDLSSFTPLNTGQRHLSLSLKNGFVNSLTLLEGNTTVSDYNLINKSGLIETYQKFDDHKNNLQAHYDAGFTTSTAPIDLKSVVYLGVKSLYENNSQAKQGNGNVKSKSVKNFSVSYGNEQSAYTLSMNNSLVKQYLASNNSILSKYQRVYV